MEDRILQALAASEARLQKKIANQDAALASIKTKLAELASAGGSSSSTKLAGAGGSSSSTNNPGISRMSRAGGGRRPSVAAVSAAVNMSRRPSTEPDLLERVERKQQVWTLVKGDKKVQDLLTDVRKQFTYGARAGRFRSRPVEHPDEEDSTVEESRASSPPRCASSS